ncbi:MAG: hypothetical protein ACODAD_15255 [Planctomycetota bacterium]
MMTTRGPKPLSAIGFLTIVNGSEQGFFGGYLILNAVGRPLEFHCTAPVRPNRAQEILYGPTLEPYLYGERIGPALLNKSKLKPVSVFTDVQPAMSARPHIATPMTLVLAESMAASDGANEAPIGSESRSLADSPPEAVPAPNCLCYFELGSYRLAVDPQYPEDETTLVGSWPQFAAHINLDEPFGRIREAIDEARRGASG